MAENSLFPLENGLEIVFNDLTRMTKYKEYFDRMVSENKEAFDEFAKLHMDYGMDEDKYQERFNTEGEEILKIIHEWESKLCKSSEGAGFGTFTVKLAEKFQEEAKHHFPLIDHIGIIVKPAFSLKKIKL